MKETKPVDLTEAQVLAIAEEVRVVLAPLCARYNMKYALGAGVQKRSDPERCLHFVLTSETKDPMWAVTSLVRAAEALKPSADDQRRIQDLTAKLSRS